MRIAVLGATGLVGRTMLHLLETRDWVDEPPVALSSSRSHGALLPFRNDTLTSADVAGFDPAGVQLALFSAGGGPSREYAPRFAEAGAWVIDNSSTWRMVPAVPLVVPEINAHTLPGPGGGIIANPNCSTIQIAAAVAPLHRAFGLKACHVTTFQSAGGAGGGGQRALAQEQSLWTDSLAAGTPRLPKAAGYFPRQIVGNIVPEIGSALPDGSFEEEDKVVRELRKILDLPQLAVTCLATRVPTWVGHAASLRCVFDAPVDRDAALAALAAAEGLHVEPDPHAYATPLEAGGTEPVYVGRVRTEPGRDDVLLLWVVADNVLKGAALNAVQIADRLVAGEV